MKRLIIVIVFIAVTAVAFSNPVMIYPIRAMWFNTNEEAIFQFDMHMDNSWMHEVSFSSGGDYYQIPDSISADSNHCINASQVFPQLSLVRESGTLYARFEEYEAYQFAWGQGDEVDLRPLLPSQAAMIIDGNYTEPHSYMWVKNPGLPSPFGDPTGIVHLNIHAQLANGSPASGIPVYFSPANWIVGSTDNSGNFSRVLYPARNHVRIKDPFTNEYLYDQINYPEPEEEININITVSGSATGEALAPGNLIIYPNVLRLSESSSLRIDFDQSAGPETHVELYDLRGRRLEQLSFGGNGDYNLPALSRGIYFLKLVDAGRVLGTRKLIVLD